MNVSVQEVIYHINTLNDAAKLFETVLVPLQLQDHIKSFQLSVAKAPIDATIDIIRLFLKNMEQQFLPLLGNPRLTYAGAWHHALEHKSPPSLTLPPDLQFLQTPLDAHATQQRNMFVLEAPKTWQELNAIQKKQQKELTKNPTIPVALQEQMTHLEKHLQLKLNPWKICCFELVIRQLTEILLNFDPEACYVDKRIQHMYRLYSAPRNRLSMQEAGMPQWLDTDVMEKLTSWRLAVQIMQRLDQLSSPSQIAFAMVLVYKHCETAVGKLLEAEAYRKYKAKCLHNARLTVVEAEPLVELAKVESNFANKVVAQDLGMNFDNQQLNDESSESQKHARDLSQHLPELAPTQPSPAQVAAQPTQKTFDEQPYELDPSLPPFQPQSVAFGMDELFPCFIFLILETKPKKLARLCSLVENFCLPPVRTNGAAVEYMMRNLQNAVQFVADGFCKYKKVKFGLVPPRFAVRPVSNTDVLENEDWKDPLGLLDAKRKEKINVIQAPEIRKEDEFALQPSTTLVEEHVVSHKPAIQLSLKGLLKNK